MDALLYHCGQFIASHGHMYTALLIAGLVGSVTHCTGMCGPLVAAQVTARLDHIPAERMQEWHRLQGAALMPYHLGRLTTYAGLGAIAGAFSGFLFASPYPAMIAAVMLVVAGITFIIYGLGLGTARKDTAANNDMTALLSKLSAPLWLNPTGLRGYALGILLGFLPCGMVMAALLAVATTGSAGAAALGMAIFGAGTIPALFGIGLGSGWLARRWRKESRIAARIAMTCNGILLCTLAAERIV